VTQKETEKTHGYDHHSRCQHPAPGFGTSACRAACASLSSKARSRSAIAIFDTAAMYENQDAVGAAIAALPKDQRYVTPPFATDRNAPTL
jgi:diketogulonate reductase-like aldo/keto reductase